MKRPEFRAEVGTFIVQFASKVEETIQLVEKAPVSAVAQSASKKYGNLPRTMRRKT